jgi:hypothetical protein
VPALDLPQVVVEIAPPESAPELKQALLDACTRAAQGATCVEAVTDQEEVPGVIAIVSWRDGGHVRLEVALRREKEWVAREITFDEQDVPAERWRAVGLVIGTLGSVIARGETPPSETEAAPPPAAPSEPKPAPKVPDRQISPHPPPRPAPLARDEPRRGWIDASFIFGSGLDPAGQRLGADLGGSARLVRAPVYAFAKASYSEGSGLHGVHATWTEASLGLAFVRKLGSGFEVAVRLDGFAERFHASVPSAGAATPTSRGRWLGGARLGGDWMWWGLHPVGVFLGSTLGWRAGTTEVRVAGAGAGTERAFEYFLRAGVAYEFR